MPNPSKRAAADPRLRDRPTIEILALVLQEFISDLIMHKQVQFGHSQ